MGPGSDREKTTDLPTCSKVIPEDTVAARRGLARPRATGRDVSRPTHYGSDHSRHPAGTFRRRAGVKAGDQLVFTMQGGISISEDPNIRFTYQPSAANVIEATARTAPGPRSVANCKRRVDYDAIG